MTVSAVLAVLPLAAAAQSDPFYVVENGQQGGPYSMDQLAAKAQSGALQQTTLVWAGGMADWTPAGNVPALQGLWQAAQTPPDPGSAGGGAARCYDPSPGAAVGAC